MSKVSLSSVVRDNTFEGAKYSTHFPRLTRLGQWSPRGSNLRDVDAFMARITIFINGYREDGLCSYTTSTWLMTRDTAGSACAQSVTPIVSWRLSGRCEAWSSSHQARQSGQNPHSTRLRQPRHRQISIVVFPQFMKINIISSYVIPIFMRFDYNRYLSPNL